MTMEALAVLMSIALPVLGVAVRYGSDKRRQQEIDRRLGELERRHEESARSQGLRLEKHGEDIARLYERAGMQRRSTRTDIPADE